MSLLYPVLEIRVMDFFHSRLQLTFSVIKIVNEDHKNVFFFSRKKDVFVDVTEFLHFYPNGLEGKVPRCFGHLGNR